MEEEEDFERGELIRYCPECHEKVEVTMNHCDNCGYGKASGESATGLKLSENKQVEWIIRDDSNFGFTGKINQSFRLPEEILGDAPPIMTIFIDWDENEVITDWKKGYNLCGPADFDFIYAYQTHVGIYENANLTIDRFIEFIKGSYRLIEDPRSTEGMTMPDIRIRSRDEPENDKTWKGRFVFRLEGDLP